MNRGTHWLMANFRKKGDPTDWAGYYMKMAADFFDSNGFADRADFEPDASCAAFRGEENHPYLP